MSNVLTAKLWKLDTTGTIVASGQAVMLNRLHYASGTTAAHTAVVTDGNDNPIATLSISGNGDTDDVDFSTFNDDSFRTFNGFKLATLGSGVLYVYLG